MRKAIYLALVALAFTGCKKDNDDPIPPVNEATKLVVWMHALYEDEALVAGQTYFNVSNYRVNVTDLRLYLSHVYGVKDNGDTTFFRDIAFLDILAGENCLVLDNPDTGNYTSFGFGLGVAPEMNSPGNPDFNIAIFDSNHPLSLFNNMYWSWAAGYRFVIFDGKYDTDGGGTGELINGYSFHTGMDQSYRSKDWNNVPFSIEQNQTTDIHIDLAIDRIFYSASDTIDIAIDNQSHGTNQELSDRVSNNIIEAMTFRQ